MLVTLLAFVGGCGSEPETDTMGTGTPLGDSVTAPTGDTATAPTADTSATDTGSRPEDRCLDPDSLDVTKWRGNVRILGRESMEESPVFALSEVSLNFYQPWTEPFEPGWDVRYEAGGIDDCSLIYLPSLEWPAYFYEEQGTVQLHFDGATYPVGSMEPYHGYGYYPQVRPLDDWGVGYDGLLGRPFGVSLTHDGRSIEAPAVISYPERKIHLQTPTFREQLPMEDVHFTWDAAPEDATSQLGIDIYKLDAEEDLPYVVRCIIEDDGDWRPPARIWDWLDGSVVEFQAQFRRKTICNVPLDDDGEYLEVAAFQDVGLSFYPIRSDERTP